MTINRRFSSASTWLPANQLVADNLLDVSHSDFLQASSFGSRAGQKGVTNHVKAELDAWSEDRAVYRLRTLSDVVLSPMAAAWVGSDQPVTRTHRFRRTPPTTSTSN